MIDCAKILEIANREMEGTDLFTVSCKCSPMNEVELLIDSDSSVTIERCAELSRKIEAEFDRDQEDFSLMVFRSIHFADGDFLAAPAHFLVGVAYQAHQGNDQDGDAGHQDRIAEGTDVFKSIP